MKIVYMGTPEFSATVLTYLIAKGYKPSLVVTQPDKPVGRKKIITPTPVKKIAIENNIEVFQPIKIKEDFQKIIDIKPDVIITAAYGQIIPKEVLAAPRILPINVHGSLLPKYRGGAPIQYSILNGDKKTGITIMQMVQKMDAGAIISQDEVEITIDDNLETLYSKLTPLACELLVKTLPSIENETYTLTQQKEELVTYSPTISKEDEHLNFEDNVIDVYNKIRALSPIPGTYCYIKGKRYKIYGAKFNNECSIVNTIMSINNELVIGCTDGCISVTDIQPEGKGKMSIKEFLNGKVEIEIGDICE